MLRGSSIFKRIIFFLLILLTITVAALFTAATVYKDELINHFVTSMNERLNTPVDVGKMEVSAFAHFPNISLLLTDVDIQSSSNSKESLLYADRIDFIINPFLLLTGDMVFESVSIRNASCELVTDKNGNINYHIFKNTRTDSISETNAIQLSKIALENVDFLYDNLQKEIKLKVLAQALSASMEIEGFKYNIWADGKVHVDTIRNKGSLLAQGLTTSLTSEIIYNDQVKSVQILPSIVQPANVPLHVEGHYNFGTEQDVSIRASAESLESSSVLALLPPNLRSTFANYSPNGKVSCDLSYNGSWLNESGPVLEIDFNLDNTGITHQDTGESLTRINGRGKLDISNSSDLSTGKLSLTNISGLFDGEEIHGNIQWNNFINPYLSIEASGRIALARLLKFYPLEAISSAEGYLDIDLSFSGATRQMTKKEFIKGIRTNGTVGFEDVSFHISQTAPHFSNLNGILKFDNNHLLIESLSGDFGNSDFVLEGQFKNAMSYLIYENERIGIDAHLSSEYIDLDELLSLNPTTDKNKPYTLAISEHVQVHFDCEIEQLSFRRFKPTNIKGDFKIRNQVAFSDQLSLNALGGSLDLLGMADASRDNLVRVSSSVALKNIAIDSVFYVFENFDQDWLVNDHLRGSLNAEVSAAMILSNHLKLYPETLKSHISTSIEGGELNNFEPLQKLSPYLDEAELRHLRFSEIRNDILIKNRTIYLPKMEISSNATDLIISGTHTLDQRINYEVQTPLVRKVRHDSDEAFGAIEKDDAGRSMLYLKIVGTTSDYYVSYDRENVKQKITHDLQKEKTELKEIFKNKGKVSSDVELAEEEYFDWEDEEDDGTNR